VHRDWDNVIVAGGAVFACLQHLTAAERHNYFHGPSASGDIDIFLIGLDKEAAELKVWDIYAHLISTLPYHEFTVVRTKSAITFVCEHPYKNVQVVLRLYRSIEEVMCFFDLDCVAVAFDGRKVYALPRAIRAFNTRYNWIRLDVFRTISNMNEGRLIKYYKRGFGSLLKKDKEKIQGGVTAKIQAKIIALNYRKESNGVPLQKASLPAAVGDVAPVNSIEDKYEDVSFIPYGPNWNALKVKEHLFDKLKEAKREHAEKTVSGDFSSFFAVGSLEELMGDCSEVEFAEMWGDFPLKIKWNRGWR